MRRALAAACAVAAAVAITAGCRPNHDEPATGSPAKPATETWDGQEFTIVRLKVDGREVPCIVYSAPRQGGLSCDWNR
jgi:hypothetical protein